MSASDRLRGISGYEGWSGALQAAFNEALNDVAHELADSIRWETERLKADGVLEHDKFRPCRDAADQIDPYCKTDDYG